MVKCEFCGKSIWKGTRCIYCGKIFCSDCGSSWSGKCKQCVETIREGLVPVREESSADSSKGDSSIKSGIALAIIALILWVIQVILAWSPSTIIQGIALSYLPTILIIVGVATALCVISAIVAIGVGVLKKEDKRV